MARRKKPCEYCENDLFPDYIEDRNGFCLWAEFYPLNNIIAVTAQANDEIGEMIERHFEIPMNYCPNCGRKLID